MRGRSMVELQAQMRMGAKSPDATRPDRWTTATTVGIDGRVAVFVYRGGPNRIFTERRSTVTTVTALFLGCAAAAGPMTSTTP
jgi:hypothetical protein